MTTAQFSAAKTVDASRWFDEQTGYHFRDQELLLRALTHRSCSAHHNERLEFLGDGIINCIAALELYARFPDLDEGSLSRLRANLVNQDALHRIALRMDLGRYLRLGEGEVRSGGARRPSMLADAVEALMGAVMLDGGFPPAQSVVRRLFADALAGIDPRVNAKDPKTLLQEHLQGQGQPLPTYVLMATHGQAHAQIFQVQCILESLDIRTEGRGASRRAAEQDAAGKAYRLAARR